MHSLPICVPTQIPKLAPMDQMIAANQPPLSPLLSFQTKPIPKPTVRHLANSPPKQTTAASTTLEQTKQLHARLIRSQFDYSNPLPGLPLAPHSSPPAQLNFLVTSYIKNSGPAAALRLYAYMRKTGTGLDNFTVPSVLKACAQLSRIRQGMEIHGFALKAGLDWDVFVHNSLMQMYSECERVDSAIRVFNEMPERDVVSWSTMIKTFTRSKSFDEAIDLVGEMFLLNIKPSDITMISMLSLFADIADLKKGRPLHTYLIKNGEAGSTNVNAITALIDMYVKCGSVSVARRVFDRMTTKSIASWSAMIAGCIRCRELEAAVELFGKMRQENVSPNEITMLSLVTECGQTGALELGKWLHACMLRNGFRMSVVLATTLVDMYCKCGDMRSAKALFDSTNEKDVMTWTAMISGYAWVNDIEEAFDLFGQMKDVDIRPNEVTMVNLLSLCAKAGALGRGRWVHAFIDKQGIESDVVLATALVDMYAKCGDIDAAYMVFSRATDKDVCMWNAMLNGLAVNGHGDKAIKLFSQMEREGIKPNDVTFIGILRACSHAGLVVEGRQFFNRMDHDYGLGPKIEHYGCMVDLLGRAGKLDEAHELINGMPFKPNVVIWGALLAACKVHKKPSLGEVAANNLLKLEPYNSGYRILLSNIYAMNHRWDEVAEVRKAMKDTGLKKTPGISSIEVNGSVHEFVMGDESHPENEKIQLMVAEMQGELKRAGYVADTSGIFLNIDEEEKETVLAYHSEKLAMAFGLIRSAPCTPIRIVKNLRVCDDCHAATKLLSKIYRRVIIVRDRNRFHRFSEGSCSCNDYW
ncbi:pentatricopeptide repeat-containing protein At1g08070, chloroplastic-like [Phoenix dactylifera]|uniref:Pentatricopeptide repeat-containing protein At1g08070, chloroplastic-like n=1 Tax=Phoenix dactylifera TaxID=42345 RepID=A0A8B7CL35_PHODC|nr:pentatricopeptide repeat-containing protein At1g08070, chloroplastic-like [Phoenix dactylifera]